MTTPLSPRQRKALQDAIDTIESSAPNQGIKPGIFDIEEFDTSPIEVDSNYIFTIPKDHVHNWTTDELSQYCAICHEERSLKL